MSTTSEVFLIAFEDFQPMGFNVDIPYPLTVSRIDVQFGAWNPLESKRQNDFPGIVELRNSLTDLGSVWGSLQCWNRPCSQYFNPPKLISGSQAFDVLVKINDGLGDQGMEAFLARKDNAVLIVQCTFHVVK
jgi:hypothetical protein